MHRQTPSRRTLSEPKIRKLDFAAVYDALAHYARRVGKREDVVAVILFGSLATGQHTGSSDADLMVFVLNSSQQFLDRADTFWSPILPIATDLLVYTMDEAFAQGKVAIPLVKRGLEEGLCLHISPGYEGHPLFRTVKTPKRKA